MTKNSDFQKELKEKVKAGVKPSQLKRSKSADNLPQNCETELKETKKELALAHSQLEPLSKLVEKQDQQINELQTELKSREEKITELTTELDKSLEKRLTNLKQPLNTQETEQLTTELNQAKRKIASLESTLRLAKYNNS
jgi:peptidoglycan hydrolase CwlO-like protein